ncbi:MAG: hypothetical protein ACRDHZ_14725 [Ktedonobacteraceae bacterium]
MYEFTGLRWGGQKAITSTDLFRKRKEGGMSLALEIGRTSVEYPQLIAEGLEIFFEGYLRGMQVMLQPMDVLTFRAGRRHVISKIGCS